MRFPIVGVLLAAATPLLLSGTLLDDAAERTRTAVEKFQAESKAPAVSVAVAVNGNVVFAEAWGFADAESETPATVESRFGLGTMTKPFTTALVAKLVEARKLEWEAPVERYVTDFPYYGKGITLSRVASHLSGIGDAFNTRNSGTREHFANAKDVLRYITSSPLLNPPGEATNYSTGAYTVLGAVIEHETKTDYLAALREHVLEPLKLTSIAALDPREPQENLVTFYAAADGGDPAPVPPYDPSFKLAGAGLIGTASDVARFASSMNRGGFLRDTSIRQLFTAQPLKKGTKTSFGLGWALGSKAGFDSNWIIGPDSSSRDVVHHPGSGIGISNWVVLDRRSGMAIVVLTNLTDAPVAGEFFDEIFAAFLAAESELRR